MLKQKYSNPVKNCQQQDSKEVLTWKYVYSFLGPNSIARLQSKNVCLPAKKNENIRQ